MVSTFIPIFNKVYFINKYTLFHVQEGRGPIQVDFKGYPDWKDQILFLAKGQYVKFLSDSFVVRRIELPDKTVFRNREARVLFKHLVSLGHIDCQSCEAYLPDKMPSDRIDVIIDSFSEAWYRKNPFRAERTEYQVIFDVKDIIDTEYPESVTASMLTSYVDSRGYDISSLVKKKVGLSIKNLLQNKRLTESKRELAFSDKPIKEVGYDVGYRDPSYFSRAFKKRTGLTPDQFRTAFDFEERDAFVRDLYAQLQKHHTEERSLAFYAERMHMSVKTLSRTVRKKLNTSMGQLIRRELIQTARSMLEEDQPVHEIAYRLGFSEANHFSAFFKHYTGETPGMYKQKKCHS